jgi:hypothetical protein
VKSGLAWQLSQRLLILAARVILVVGDRQQVISAGIVTLR